MTPDERAEEIYNHAVTADAAGIMNSTLHMLARQTVQEILSSDHAGMEAQITDRLRAALRNSIADAAAYLWDSHRFEVQAPDRDAAKSLDETVTSGVEIRECTLPVATAGPARKSVRSHGRISQPVAGADRD
jgi:hypothetical protein